MDLLTAGFLVLVVLSFCCFTVVVVRLTTDVFVEDDAPLITDFLVVVGGFVAEIGLLVVVLGLRCADVVVVGRGVGFVVDVDSAAGIPVVEDIGVEFPVATLKAVVMADEIARLLLKKQQRISHQYGKVTLTN